MDLYGDSFKLQEMIDSDMRTEIDEFMPSQMFSDGGQRGSLSPTLTSLAPSGLSEPMDSMDNIAAIDTGDFLGNGGIGVTWISTNGHPMYGFNMDLDALGGLLVNPQTGLPISLSMPTALSPVITSTAGTMTLNDANVSLSSPITGHQPQNSRFSDIDNLTLNQISNTSPVAMPIYLFQNVTGSNARQNNQIPSEVNLNSAAQAQREAQQKSESVQNDQQQTQPRVTETPKKKVQNKANSFINNNSTSLDFPKPAYSYSCLIAMALKNSKSGSLPVNEIYNFMTEHFPYFKTAPAGWKNSVRHNLSLNKCFEKVDKPVPVNTGGARKGCLWAMNPAKISKMEEELRKWRSRNAVEIRRSMANPEKLEMLEKGEMRPPIDEGLEEDDNVDSDDAQQPVVSSTEEEMERVKIKPDQLERVLKIKSEILEGEQDMELAVFKMKPTQQDIFKIKMEPSEMVDSSNMNSPDDELPSLESSIQLDDLELQKGLWDALDDERLQFLGESLSNSSLLNTPMCEDATSPASNQVSFINCNYVYSPLSNENVSSSTSTLNNQESVVTSSEGHAR